ncbi:class I SAM-dependent methyltransferase [Acetobacterium sp. KB-1]|jgi:ubiquinone/menaquinone biosynthesis C-methylase UbiE|uniref:class I SAM-dependent methyltransferase n=1 Tax=Acetobacterium sp. KB-1 TaxID=2184575 RepID=UPI000DBECDDC|nr:class I SAM-dependent methyltransferase [Acetobacterium sp. KB-1]AWW26391.1 methyltransferase type 11 [Acetobacterium sp. KB-1]
MDTKKNEWNNSYINKDNYVFYPHEEIIRFVSKYIKKRVGISDFKPIIEEKKGLDMGCGIGRHIIYLDEMELEPYGIDISDYAIEYAKKWFYHENKTHLIDRLTVGSVEQFPYEDNSFDFVISHGVLDSMEFNTAVIGVLEVFRVLKKGCYFYFDVVSGDDFNHYREYAGEELVKSEHEKNTIQSYFNYRKIKKLLGDNFEIIECILIQRESVINQIKNSRYHIIAKKREL